MTAHAIRRHIRLIEAAADPAHAERVRIFDELCDGLVPGGDHGNYRKVYDHKEDRSCVIKIADGTDGVEHNQSEMRVWTAAKGTPVENFLAPIDWISEHGTCICQWMTSELTDFEIPIRLPQRIPRLLAKEETDTVSLGNWSVLLGPGGRVVCHDYGGVPPELVADPREQELVAVAYDDDNFAMMPTEAKK